MVRVDVEKEWKLSGHLLRVKWYLSRNLFRISEVSLNIDGESSCTQESI
jgi:hypothetical protein